MSLKSLGDWRSTTTWRTHSANEDDIFNFHERLFLALSIVPTLMVHPLSEQLDGWLSTILFFLWHVEIINEDHETFTWGWSIDSLSSLFKFLIKGVLGLIG
jgi:hypothetical protein